MSNNNYEKAKKKVKQKKEFLEHLNTYAGVMVVLFVINVFLARGRGFWMIYPMMGWGVGLLIHYLSVFGFPGLRPIDDEWEEEEIQKEMERQQKQGNSHKSEMEDEETLDLPEISEQKDKLEDLIDRDTFRD